MLRLVCTLRLMEEQSLTKRLEQGLKPPKIVNSSRVMIEVFNQRLLNSIKKVAVLMMRKKKS